MAFANRYPGGTELELSMLFVDVRGSTRMAERMTPAGFSELMNRFYRTATEVLIGTDAVIDKLVGDEVIGLYLPIFTGPNHARPAVLAARELLRATGHGDEEEPWLPIGIGVHTGVAFVGTVAGAEGTVSDITALAPPGEAWIFGSDGTLRIEPEARRLSGGRRGDRAVREIDIPAGRRIGWRVEEEFVNAIRGRERVSHTTFEDGVRYMEFTDAVHRSAARSGWEAVREL